MDEYTNLDFPNTLTDKQVRWVVEQAERNRHIQPALLWDYITKDFNTFFLNENIQCGRRPDKSSYTTHELYWAYKAATYHTRYSSSLLTWILMLNSYHREHEGSSPSYQQSTPVQNFHGPASTSRNHLRTPIPSSQTQLQSGLEYVPHLNPSQTVVDNRQMYPANVSIPNYQPVTQQPLAPRNSRGSAQSGDDIYFGGESSNWPSLPSGVPRLPVTSNAYSMYSLEYNQITDDQHHGYPSLSNRTPVTSANIHQRQPLHAFTNLMSNPQIVGNMQVQTTPPGRQVGQVLLPIQSEVPPLLPPNNSQSLHNSPGHQFTSDVQKSYNSERHPSEPFGNPQAYKSTPKYHPTPQTTVSTYKQGDTPPENDHLDWESDYLPYHNSNQESIDHFGPWLELHPQRNQPTGFGRSSELLHTPTASPVTQYGLDSLPSTTTSFHHKPTDGADIRQLNNPPVGSVVEMNSGIGKSNKRPAEGIPEDNPTKATSKRQNQGILDSSVNPGNILENNTVSIPDLGGQFTVAGSSEAPALDEDYFTKVIANMESSTVGEESSISSFGVSGISNQTPQEGPAGDNRVFKVSKLQADVSSRFTDDQPQGLDVPKTISISDSSSIPTNFAVQSSATSNKGAAECQGILQNSNINNSAVVGRTDKSFNANIDSVEHVAAVTRHASEAQAIFSSKTNGLHPDTPYGASVNAGFDKNALASISYNTDSGSEIHGAAVAKNNYSASEYCNTLFTVDNFVDPCKTCEGYDLYDPDNICRDCYHIVRPEFARNKFRDPNAPYVQELRARVICHAPGNIYCIDDMKGEFRCMNCRTKILG